MDTPLFFEMDPFKLEVCQVHLALYPCLGDGECVWKAGPPPTTLALSNWEVWAFCPGGPVLISWTRVINNTTSRRCFGKDLKPHSPSNLTTEFSESHWFEFQRRKILGFHRNTLLPGNQCPCRKVRGRAWVQCALSHYTYLSNYKASLHLCRDSVLCLMNISGEKMFSHTSLSGNHPQWYLQLISWVLPRAWTIWQVLCISLTIMANQCGLNFRHKKINSESLWW